MNRMISLVNKAFQAIGFKLQRIHNSLPYKRMQCLSEQSITLVLDVGANRGQFAKEIRQNGYTGKIVSFEPIPHVYEQLKENFQNDNRHISRQSALGSSENHVSINILQSDASSSILDPNPQEMPSIHALQPTGQKTVPMTTLDNLQDELFSETDRVYLKIDTQGFEMEVLNGAQQALHQVLAIEIELSSVELYSGQTTHPTLWNHLEALGYRSIWLERGYVDPITGHLLQCDAIFIKSK